MGFGLLAASPLTRLMGADSETVIETTIYIRTILIFVPFIVLNNIQQAFVRNDGNPSLSIKAMFIGSIVLDYIFIFPLELGMFGAALATSISPLVGLSILSFYYKNIFHQLQFNYQKIKLMTILNIGYLGASSLVNELSSAIVMFTFNNIIFLLEGNKGLAAYGIWYCRKYFFLVMSLFVGLAQGSQPILSGSFGQKNRDHLRKILSLSVLSSLVIAACIYIFMFSGSESIVNLFNNEEKIWIAEIARVGIRLYFIGFFFAGMNVVFTSCLAAVAQPKASLFFSLLRGGSVIVPLVVVLSQILDMTGVWVSFVVAEALVFLWIMIQLVRSRKKIYNDL